MYTVGRTQRPFWYELPPYKLLPPSFVGKSCGRIRGGEKSGTAVPLVFVTPPLSAQWDESGGVEAWGILTVSPKVFRSSSQKKLVTPRRRGKSCRQKKQKRNRKLGCLCAKENLVYTGSRKGDLLTVLSLTHSHPRCNFSGLSLPQKLQPRTFLRPLPTVTRFCLNAISSDELRKFPIRRPIALSLLKMPLVHRSLSLAPDSLLSRQPLIFEP